MIEEHNSIGIFGVPRSGTSWLGQIFNSHPDVNFKFQPLFSYAFKDFLDEHSSSDKINEFYTKIGVSDDYFLNMKDADIHKNYPKFSKSVSPHLLVFKEVRYHHVIENILHKSQNHKFIFIIRNPLSVLSSWAKAPKEFNPIWDFNEEWRFAKKKNLNRKEEFYGFDGWKRAANIYHQLKIKFPDRIELVSYANLLANTELTSKKLFEFAGLIWNEQTENFIKESISRKDNDPNSVYKAKITDMDWKGFIPAKIQLEIIEELKGTPLFHYLL